MMRMRRDPIFHENTPSIAFETLMLERRFRRSRVRVNFVLIWHYLAQRRGIWVVVAGLLQIESLQAI